jgi:hypothetical protein
MKRTKLPRAKFTSDPYINGFTEVERDVTDILIGSSHKPDELFNFEDEAEYIRLLVKIVPKFEFERPQISAKYRMGEDDDDRVMSFDIYGGESIDMLGFVSSITITFHGLSCEPTFLSEKNIQFLIDNPDIYTKSFQTQSSDIEIENFVDDSLEESDIIHTKTKAHFFAGSYHGGIRLSDIQQYMFYMGTEYQANEYISVISGRDLINLKRVNSAEEVTLESLSTLEDDIVDRRITLTLLDGLAYRSVSAEKTTVTSDVFQILFKKEVQ